MSTPAADGSIGSRVAKGAAWLIVTRFLVRGIGLFSTIILARLLVPEDFGLIALATVVVAFLEMLGDFKFDMAIIHYQTTERRVYDTVWTFSVLRGLAIAAILSLASEQIAQFFGDPRLAPVLVILSLVAVIDGFQNVGIVEFNKELEFNKLLRLQVVSKIVSFCVTIGFAVVWKNYWALVAGMIARSAVFVVMTYVMHAYRPRVSLAGWHKLFHFSKWLLFNNIILFFNRKLDALILGTLESTKSLGIYNVASEIASLPSSELVQPIQAAFFPGYAKLAHDRARLTNAYVRSFAVVGAIIAPAGLGIGLTADYFVRVLLGPKWVATIPLIQLLAVAGVMRVLSANTGSVFNAIGVPQCVTFLSGASLVVQFFALSIGVKVAGVYGAACAMVVTAVLIGALSFLYLLRHLELRPTEMLLSIWRSAAALLAMATVVLWVESYWPPVAQLAGLIVQLACISALGASVYAASHLLLWRLVGCPDGSERVILGAVLGAARRATQGRGDPVATE